ncbi:SIS domain-containing protein [Coprothermobacteraceae bacterium]|nr:SIS domain-containing protein [Coprothermobacteraceae bacterium]
MKYFDVAERVINQLRDQEENMKRAARLIADTVIGGGIVQAFGSGHSFAAAMEISGRAGGLLPVKAVFEETFGRYERLEGVGTEFCKSWDLRRGDCLILISNSGRNPFIIEVAAFAKSINVPVIAVTSVEVSKAKPSRHSSGLRLFEMADVVLDNHTEDGDAAVSIDGLNTKVCGTSTLASVLLLNQTMVFAIEEMLERGYEPPVLVSNNVDGGPEYNEKLLHRYLESYGYRIFLRR